MGTLIGTQVYLRALEPTDLDFLYRLENDESIWELGDTRTPYSKFVLKQYLENAHRSIYEAKQLRLTICKGDEQLGFIDLFDFDAIHKRAGVAIIIAEAKERQKGYGAEALRLLCDYAFSNFDLHQLYANIAEDNLASIKLFTSLGFEQAGVRRDWLYQNGSFKDQLLFQKIK
ncbi:GNAT family N-acetyltransferase [Sungkyunkwania multivorans]|uniref:GNAT family N-acetyltransferase n=1 Tax=Sungkyunkwania multivorans TaxID=1173618 RepID=A0ABW3CXP4_9FLAO